MSEISSKELAARAYQLQFEGNEEGIRNIKDTIDQWKVNHDNKLPKKLQKLYNEIFQ